ncbi:peptide chain release factor N(5)-glutamine methyltransferase [Lacticaseibacillus pabuli]|uniref:Release factor glutamine methyltransferase n=1 Tax=Lacticaseibacillus pabuli TaxID=3025672 RepID=A0ABY7WRY9_9LACO|nr:peptide chain release factor N(5)-glutamine methyltransferase [Lacticaseibacillus sp. KACC 23028]WDF81772.1 peptide chain release factor N(5)-glutamine methyltransferase [Lacticaseibacillus sp. KACC 23028]
MTKTYAEALKRASLLLQQANLNDDGAAYVLSERKHWTRTQIIIHGRDEMTPEDERQFHADVAALLKDEPAQYVTGTAPFWGRTFHVDKRVLIPRFDTEVIVSWVLDDWQQGTGLDLGTGSGSIGVTLALERPNIAMTLSDVSADALTVAQQNAHALGARVQATRSDLLSDIDGQFDFIISNLPYIDRAEMPVMDESTKEYEPDLALYADNHGLALFEALFKQLPGHVRPGGSVYLEFGYHQRAALARMIALMLPEQTADFRRDDAGHDRAVRINF